MNYLKYLKLTKLTSQKLNSLIGEGFFSFKNYLWFNFNVNIKNFKEMDCHHRRFWQNISVLSQINIYFNKSHRWNIRIFLDCFCNGKKIVVQPLHSINCFLNKVKKKPKNNAMILMSNISECFWHTHLRKEKSINSRKFIGFLR